MTHLEATAAADPEIKNEDMYLFEDGRVMRRRMDGKTPNGNPFAGRWVLSAPDGSYIDHDQYRHDLAERHSLRL